jgi:hypothetical protein
MTHCYSGSGSGLKVPEYPRFNHSGHRAAEPCLQFPTAEGALNDGQGEEAGYLRLLLLQMNPMKQSMHPWRQDDPYYSDEYQTAEESVKGREQLGGCRFHTVHRTHATEDHRSVQKRVDSIQPSNRVVAQSAKTDGA